MRVPEMSTTHPIMTCPVCQQSIEAEVTVKAELGKPEVRATYSVNVPVTGKLTRFNVLHHCHGVVEADDPATAATESEAR